MADDQATDPNTTETVAKRRKEAPAAKRFLWSFAPCRRWRRRILPHRKVAGGRTEPVRNYTSHASNRSARRQHRIQPQQATPAVTAAEQTDWPSKPPFGMRTSAKPATSESHSLQPTEIFGHAVPQIVRPDCKRGLRQIQEITSRNKLPATARDKTARYGFCGTRLLAMLH